MGYLAVSILVVLLVPGVVVLLDEAEVFLPLALQSQLPSLHVGGEITLQETPRQGRASAPTTNQPPKSHQAAVRLEASGTCTPGQGKESLWVWAFSPAPSAFSELVQPNLTGFSFPKWNNARSQHLLEEDLLITLPGQKTYSSPVGQGKDDSIPNRHNTSETEPGTHKGVGLCPQLSTSCQISPPTPAPQLRVLTERRRHVTGRTSLGTPGQLHFLSSSANGQWWQWIRS